MSSDTVIELVDSVSSSTNTVAICGLFRSRGGASRVIEQQAIDLTEAGYDVTVFALEADIDPPEGVTLKTVNPIQNYTLLSKIYWLLFPLLPWMVYTAMKLREFDLVISHRYPFTLTSHIASQTSDTTYIFWSHPPTNSTEAFSGLASVWYRLIHRFEIRGRSVAKADHICAVSEDSKEYLESHIDRTVSVVPNKINERRFTKVTDREELQDRYGIDDKDQVILFVGRITERKNIHSLVRVFENISKKVENTKLVIAGSESQSEYADRVKENTGSDVIFTGYVSNEDLAGLYSMADVFATCSLEEGWGLPITEAGHFDTPIVAFESHPAARVADRTILVERENYEEFRQGINNYINN